MFLGRISCNRSCQVALCAVLGVGNISPAQIGLILTYTSEYQWPFHQTFVLIDVLLDLSRPYANGWPAH